MNALDYTADKEFEYTESDFEHAKTEIFKIAGISLSEHKKLLVYSRLTPRLRKNGLTRFKDYFDLIKRNPEEQIEFINALTTNKTSFYRENHHFDMLREEIIPKCIKEKSSCKIWSAGCSSGQEPYNIAILLDPYKRSSKVGVLATDLDSNILARAKRGVYDMQDVEDIPKDVLKKYFFKGKGSNVGKVKVGDEIKALVDFKQLNLMHKWPMTEKFDVIFCRNVIIYFDKPTQKTLFGKYCDMLNPGGYLILGHSESMGVDTGGFEFVGKTTYRKRQ